MGVVALTPGRGVERTPARRRATWWSRDALRLAGAVLLGPLSGRPVRARGAEAYQRLPGDDLLPAAKGQWTNAITIHARPGDIWPWLVQLGCRRAGWYSYDGLDNGAVPSAERIVAELQHAEVGDLFPWTPTAMEQDGFHVHLVEPERALVIGGDAGSLFRLTWAFVLQPLDDGRTRLVARARGEYDRLAARLYLPLVGHPLHFAMQRRQLVNLRSASKARGGTAGSDPYCAVVDERPRPDDTTSRA